MLRTLIAVVLGVGVSAGAWFGGEQLEEGIEARLFEEQVERVGKVAIARLSNVLVPVETFGLFAAQREVNAATFVPELKARADQAPGLRAMAWLPVVKKGEPMEGEPEAPSGRDLFEQQVQRYYQGFEIREQTPEGVVQTAGPATAWVPFLLVQPDHTNDVLRGLDIGNLPPLAETMQQTYMRNKPVTSPLFEFTGIDTPLILALYYVDKPEGFSAALIEPAVLAEEILEGRPEGLVVRLTDDTTTTVVYEEDGFVEEGSARFSTSLGGRSYSLDVAAGPTYQPTQIQLALPLGLAGGGVTVLMVALTLLGGKEPS